MHDAPLEAHEQSGHAAEHHDPFTARVAILISLLAVLAAVAGNLESIESEKTLASAGEATLEQDLATDAWSEYQADSVKRHLYMIAAESNRANAAKYTAVANENERKQAAIRVHATDAERERVRLLADSRAHETRHHWLTGSATLFEIAIALSTVSIITRRNWFWAGAALLGIGGIALLATAFV